jgi:hypothetical protein
MRPRAPMSLICDAPRRGAGGPSYPIPADLIAINAPHRGQSTESETGGPSLSAAAPRSSEHMGQCIGNLRGRRCGLIIPENPERPSP